MPAPKRSERSAPDQDRKAGAGPRQRAVRGQAHRRRHRRRLRRHLPRRPREAEGRRQVQGAGRDGDGSRPSCTPSTPTSAACAGRASSRSRRPARWQFTFEAWTDRWATWHDELRRKVDADLDEDLSGEISEGVVLLERALEQRRRRRKGSIEYAIGVLGSPTRRCTRSSTSRSARSSSRRWRQPRSARARPTLEKPIPVEVDRVKARFCAWYELFPRSWGGLKAVEALRPGDRRPRLRRPLPAAVPPDRRQEPQGPQQHARPPARTIPARPYAIGGAEGGHFAVHPELGTEQDVRDLCATAHQHGMDVALDIALNASADHPWLTEHPEWFQQRPDGTLKYAENPPKRYQDIYNFNWDTRRLAVPVERLARRLPALGRLRHQVLPGRQPAHEAVRRSGSGSIKEVHKVDRDVVFLSRGLHAPSRHARAGQARLHAVLHVLHVEELAPRDDRVLQRARLGRGEGVLPAQLLPGHAGHPARLPAARRPAGVRHPARPRRPR